MKLTQKNGLIGELKAIELFISNGWGVSKPINQTDYDLHIQKEKKCYLIQCKFRTMGARGTVEIKNKRTRNFSKTVTVREYQRYDERIDYFTIYVPCVDKIYVVPYRLFKHKSSLTLRLIKSLNKQRKDVLYANRFHNPKWLYRTGSTH